ncbi:MAG: PEP-CTERM sorting domain-containing protein [Paludisphaera borealis]|uniref:PEP-CTERM sorting domain-containing protein n=1 Tax=Paludisphaera borealis TaxID=1387353 RepID=UPI00284A8F7C|nr:PEP-CTERM sorting domain-containing protein [Paludisphaera borealis]MDR3620380.1 PEP-CTERM sorting domain-containing protein [Paludisphaera borealis]
MLKQLTLAMGLVAAMATTGSASSVYGTDVTGANLTGSRSGSPGIVGTGNYADVSVNWTITNTSAGVWHYDYTFAVNHTNPNISHVLLELSPNSITDPHVVYNLTGGTTEFGTFGASQGNSNPGIPADIYGVKITPSSSATTLHLVFDSDRSPVWGDFYTKGGQSYAYNKGLDPAYHNSDSITLFIARPDGNAGTVPEPSSIALLGCGAFGLVGYGLRRRKASRA